MRKLLIAISLVCSLLVLFACTSNVTNNEAAPEAGSSTNNTSNIVQLVDAPEDVQTLYSSRCLNCHAIDLSGKMGAPTNLQQVHERLSYEEIVDVISNGRELMPAFAERLSENEISALASWLSKQ